MDDYITNLCTKLDHPTHKKNQHYPHRHTPINYGAKFQCAAETHISPLLNNSGKLPIQQLVGSIRYYARSVDKKILVDLREIYQQQSSPTKDTNTEMLQLLD